MSLARKPASVSYEAGTGAAARHVAVEQDLVVAARRRDDRAVALVEHVEEREVRRQLGGDRAAGRHRRAGPRLRIARRVVGVLLRGGDVERVPQPDEGGGDRRPAHAIELRAELRRRGHGRLDVRVGLGGVRRGLVLAARGEGQGGERGGQRGGEREAEVRGALIGSSSGRRVGGRPDPEEAAFWPALTQRRVELEHDHLGVQGGEAVSLRPARRLAGDRIVEEPRDPPNLGCPSRFAGQPDASSCTGGLCVKRGLIAAAVARRPCRLKKEGAARRPANRWSLPLWLMSPAGRARIAGDVVLDRRAVGDPALDAGVRRERAEDARLDTRVQAPISSCSLLWTWNTYCTLDRTSARPCLPRTPPWPGPVRAIHPRQTS